MTTEQQPEAATAVFLQTVTGAVADLKNRLQHDYEQAYPNLAEIIHIVLDEEEANAWELSFPHLFLPDLVEAHIAKLNLQPGGKQARQCFRSPPSYRNPNLSARFGPMRIAKPVQRRRRTFLTRSTATNERII
jgi:hypothetical protein